MYLTQLTPNIYIKVGENIQQLAFSFANFLEIC